MRHHTRHAASLLLLILTTALAACAPTESVYSFPSDIGRDEQVELAFPAPPMTAARETAPVGIYLVPDPSHDAESRAAFIILDIVRPPHLHSAHVISWSNNGPRWITLRTVDGAAIPFRERRDSFTAPYGLMVQPVPHPFITLRMDGTPADAQAAEPLARYRFSLPVWLPAAFNERRVHIALADEPSREASDPSNPNTAPKGLSGIVPVRTTP